MFFIFKSYKLRYGASNIIFVLRSCVCGTDIWFEVAHSQGETTFKDHFSSVSNSRSLCTGFAKSYATEIANFCFICNFICNSFPSLLPRKQRWEVRWELQWLENLYHEYNGLRKRDDRVTEDLFMAMEDCKQYC